MDLMSGMLSNLFCLLILHSAKIIFPFSIKPVSQVPAVPTTNLRSSVAQPKQWIIKKPSILHFFQSNLERPHFIIIIPLKINIVAVLLIF